MTIEFCDRCLKALNDNDNDKYVFPLMGFKHCGDYDILVDGKDVTLCKDCVKKFVKNMDDFAHGKDIKTTRLINLQLPF